MLTDNVLDLIGRTPPIRLKPELVFAKAEFLNHGGSIKDRVALDMIHGAERDGRLRPDSILVEPTSGNTGIGIALVGRLKGYRLRIVMPENMTEERTLTTVGYGDISPKTAPGQLLASLIMILGYRIIAVPTGIVTVELSSAATRERRKVARVCPQCLAEGHDDDALHCKYCGAELSVHDEGVGSAADSEKPVRRK